MLLLDVLLQSNFGIQDNQIFSQNDSQLMKGTCEILNAKKHCCLFNCFQPALFVNMKLLLCGENHKLQKTTDMSK